MNNKDVLADRAALAPGVVARVNTERPEKGVVNAHISEAPYGMAFLSMDFLVGPVENFTLTSISGGGGGALPFAVTGVQPISISGSSRNYHRTFIPRPDGLQVTLTLDASSTPIAEGHWLRVVWATRQGVDPAMVMLRNFDTGDEVYLEGPGKTTLGNVRNATSVVENRPFRMRFLWRRFRNSAIVMTVLMALLFAILTFSPDPAIRTATDMYNAAFLMVFFVVAIALVLTVVFSLFSAISPADLNKIRKAAAKELV